MAAKAKPADESEKFLGILEGGVKAVLKDVTATAGERVAAITAGAKLLAIQTQNQRRRRKRGFSIMTDAPVRQLFADRQPGPSEADINPTYIEMARTVASICATRSLLMIAVITGAAIWSWTIYGSRHRQRLYAACGVLNRFRCGRWRRFITERAEPCGPTLNSQSVLW